jgi:hypothetical protein
VETPALITDHLFILCLRVYYSLEEEGFLPITPARLLDRKKKLAKDSRIGKLPSIALPAHRIRFVKTELRFKKI